MPAWTVLLFAFCLADTPAAAVDPGEVKNLQGKWQVLQHVHGGKKSEAKDLVSLTLEVTGTKSIVRDGVDIKEESVLVLLKPATKPGSVDLKITAGPDLDRIVKGIYKVVGDELTVCVAEPGKDRPREFDAAAGTGHTLMVFKRLK